MRERRPTHKKNQSTLWEFIHFMFKSHRHHYPSYYICWIAIKPESANSSVKPFLLRPTIFRIHFQTNTKRPVGHIKCKYSVKGEWNVFGRLWLNIFLEFLKVFEMVSFYIHQNLVKGWNYCIKNVFVSN